MRKRKIEKETHNGHEKHTKMESRTRLTEKQKKKIKNH